MSFGWKHFRRSELANHFGIPAGFISDEKVAIDQALQALPWAKAVAVEKQKETYTSREKSRTYLAEVQNNLRETAVEKLK